MAVSALRRNGFLQHATRWDSLLLLGAILFHLGMAPYTKVEESFNVQAMHDLLYHRTDLQKYDHFEFPGVVPRTFIGAMVVAAVSSPLVFLSAALGFPKLASLYIVRGGLGVLVWASLVSLRQSIGSSLGPLAARLFCVLCALQFHLPFYASRPLPNVFALCLANLGYSYWLQGKPKGVLRCLVVAMVVLRCDLLVLLGPVGLALLLTGSISFFSAFLCCAVAALLSLGLTVAVDSVMWQRVLWPEGAVLFFNTALNKSAEWGVSPFPWYFTSALPRSLLAGMPLALVGITLEPRVRPMASAALLFVSLYSFLPHKELRFIFPSIPALNVAAAAALARILQNWKKPAWRLLALASVGLLALSLAATALFAAASYANYPGGTALSALHSAAGALPGSVHIGVLAAMTGVSRFCEQPPPWRYSKQEDIPPHLLHTHDFTYLLSDQRSVEGFQCLGTAPGFPKLKMRTAPHAPAPLNKLLRVPALELRPAVHILVANSSLAAAEAIWKLPAGLRLQDWACTSEDA